jgi:ABC-type Mn2+/Zn2+ transport system ATPase subunit
VARLTRRLAALSATSPRRRRGSFDVTILSIQNVSVTLDERPILRDVSFTIERGESVAIIGPNGSGKTILRKAILGLLP